jgi:hypothetical protein
MSAGTIRQRAEPVATATPNGALPLVGLDMLISLHQNDLRKKRRCHQQESNGLSMNRAVFICINLALIHRTVCDEVRIYSVIDPIFLCRHSRNF